MGKKQNNDKSGAAARHKEQLRQEAEQRQAKRDGRTTEQQLALINSRPGNSEREKERLKEKS